jgi:hypothetical protein
MNRLTASFFIGVEPGLRDSLDNSIRDELQRGAQSYFLWVLISAFIVVIGVTLEGPEILHEMWPSLFTFFTEGSISRIRKFKKAIKIVGLVGWLLVVFGVMGEEIFEALQNRAEGQLQTFNDSLLREARLTAGTAKQAAIDAESAASRARDETDALSKEANDERFERATLEAEFIKGEPRITLLNPSHSQIVKRLLPMAGQKFMVLSCLRDDDEEGIRTTSFLASTLQRDAKWTNVVSPGSSVTGRSCGTSGVLVMVGPNVPEASQANAKVLSSVLESVLKTGVFFAESKGNFRTNFDVVRYIIRVSVPAGIPLPEDTIVVEVGEHPYPMSPPHLNSGAKTSKTPDK